MTTKKRIISLRTLIKKSTLPIVGIGPMSKTCVENVFKYSHKNNRPLFLIATRRQIEAECLGRGYVNNWTTEQFSKYILALKKKYPKNVVYICRDHGGPWQGNNETSLNYKEALNRSLISFKTDILCNFDILHIDPSTHPKTKLTYKTVVSRIKKILLYCHNFAEKCNKKIEFEVGTEETSGCITNLNEFQKFIEEINLFCKAKMINKPLFVVGQTGSLVKELRQVGNFNLDNTKKLVTICDRLGVLFKEHNADYLEEYHLSLRKRSGIHAINIAPEFGVIETQCFKKQCYEEDKINLLKKFMKLSLSSNKWKKWAIDENFITDLDKSLIAGHYIFTDTRFIKLKECLNYSKLNKKIKSEISKRLSFYNGK